MGVYFVLGLGGGSLSGRFFIGRCLLFPVVASLSGGVSFFVSGIFCGFSFSDWVCDCVAKVVVYEWVCAGGIIHEGYIV